MPTQINSKNTPQTYDAGDMLDAYCTGQNDVKWLSMGIDHLKEEFYKTRAFIQDQYKVSDAYFEKMAEFLDMYQYLADDRLQQQDRYVEKFKEEWEADKKVVTP